MAEKRSVAPRSRNPASPARARTNGIFARKLLQIAECSDLDGARSTFALASVSTGRTLLGAGGAGSTNRSADVPAGRTNGRFVRPAGTFADRKVNPAPGASPRSAHGRETRGRKSGPGTEKCAWWGRSRTDLWTRQEAWHREVRTAGRPAGGRVDPSSGATSRTSSYHTHLGLP